MYIYVYIHVYIQIYIRIYIIILARYDYPCIFPILVKILGEVGEISCLKKGAQYFAIYTDMFTFTDVLHYTSPCKYSDYLKQWGVVEEKSIFPYQYYSSIEELEAASEFPPIEGFYSDLTETNVSEEDYAKAKEEFDQRRNLPGKEYTEQRQI